MAIFRKLFLAIKRTFRRRKPLKRKASKKKRVLRRPIKIRKRKVTARPSKKISRKPKPVSKFRKKLKAKKSAKKTVSIKPAKPAKQDEGILVGEVTHYFSRIEVCVVKITSGSISVGDRLRIAGRTTHFVQQVKSLQIENADVRVASKGALVGLKVIKEAREGDRVYRVS